MGLSWSAVTIAGHLTIVFSLVFALVNAVAARARWPLDHGPERMLALAKPLIAVGSAISVERLYYVTARLLKNTPVNLWEAHPVPYLLSLMISLPLLWLAVSARLVVGPPTARDKVILRGQIALVIGVFAAVSAGLW